MIRLANKDDLVDVLTLYNELRPSDPTLPESLAIERWQQIINDDRTHIVVADINGTLAATCALSINLSIAVSARPFGLIEHVVTRRDFRRQGLSQQVLSYAIDLAWQLSCYKVMLLSGAKLNGAHKVYSAVGFDGDRERGFVIKAPNIAAQNN
ncbi:GNAT family N-acetyltransferase [Pseudoalteromonas spongiae]|uniref:GNAT family N-acetyltransferase n=1 Tax=Pseudoalteromonas spongiae TaxID=298657 RepID=UPI00110C103A|nr:GNAT family N-acetyltransferase [Pseudoalteromonas spongiae]TMO83518.1 GNAT family N-acetyltransferase [Pseudoalteromonas spongiae]